MRLGFRHLVVFIAGFIFTLSALDFFTHKSSSSEQVATPSWNDLAEKSINSVGHKKRNLVPSVSESRKPSSESADLILQNEKGKYIIQGNLVNIEKVTNRPAQNRLVATNLSSGKLGYLSGEVIIKSSSIDKSRFPLNTDGFEIIVARQLSSDKYILSVSPASEVTKAIDYLKLQFQIESLKVDIVDREIKAL